jgi:hypothetical protein
LRRADDGFADLREHAMQIGGEVRAIQRGLRGVHGVARVDEAAEFVDVGARTKCLARAGEYQRLNGRVTVRGLQGVEQRLREFVVERIALLGAAHRQHAHAGAVFNEEARGDRHIRPCEDDD